MADSVYDIDLRLTHAIYRSPLVQPYVPADGKPHMVDVKWLEGEDWPRVTVDGVLRSPLPD